MQHSCPLSCAVGASQTQEGLEANSSLGQMLAHVPEAKQCHAQTKSPVQIAGLEKPVESVFANGFQHRKARLAVRAVHPLDEVFVDQRGQAFKKVDTEIFLSVA